MEPVEPLGGASQRSSAAAVASIESPSRDCRRRRRRSLKGRRIQMTSTEPGKPTNQRPGAGSQGGRRWPITGEDPENRTERRL